MTTKRAGDLIEPSDEPDMDLFRSYINTTFTPSGTSSLVILTKQSTHPGNIALFNTGGFTAIRDGLYLITMSLRTTRNVNTDSVIQWRQNAAGSNAGGTQMYGSYPAIVSGTAGNFSWAGSFFYYLSAGDTAEMFISASGTPTNFIVGGATTTQVNALRLPGTPSLT